MAIPNTSPPRPTAHRCLVFLGLLWSLAIAGCAVQGGSPGRPTTIGLDPAAVFGTEVQQFTLADGSKGAVRLLNGNYSVKLEKYFKVIDIRQAQKVRVLSVEQFGSRTTLVLEKSSGSCQFRLQLLSIEGSAVSTWDLGDCRQPTEVSRDGDTLVFDRVAGNRTVRAIYQDDRLYNVRDTGVRNAPTGQGRPGGSTTARTTAGPNNRQAALVPADAPRHQPAPPLTQDEFRAALAETPFLPEMGPTRVAQAPRTPDKAPRLDAPPPRRALPGRDEDEVMPVQRIKLD